MLQTQASKKKVILNALVSKRNRTDNNPSVDDVVKYGLVKGQVDYNGKNSNVYELDDLYYVVTLDKTGFDGPYNSLEEIESEF